MGRRIEDQVADRRELSPMVPGRTSDDGQRILWHCSAGCGGLEWVPRGKRPDPCRCGAAPKAG